MTLRIETNRNQEWCIEKLKCHTDLRLFAMIYSTRPIVGTIKDDRVMLHKRTPLRQNSFGRCFYGTFRREMHTTILEGQFTLYKPIKFTLSLMIIIFVSFLLMMIMGLMIRQNIEGILSFGLPMWFGMLAFGIFIYWFSMRMSMKEETYLIEFLNQILEATSVLEPLKDQQSTKC